MAGCARSSCLGLRAHGFCVKRREVWRRLNRVGCLGLHIEGGHSHLRHGGGGSALTWCLTGPVCRGWARDQVGMLG
jgi:hypothetical protein